MEILYIAVALYLLSVFVNSILSESFVRSKENNTIVKLANSRSMFNYQCFEEYGMRLSPNRYLLDAVCIKNKDSPTCLKIPGCDNIKLADAILDVDNIEKICNTSSYANKNHPCNKYLKNTLTRLTIDSIKI